MQRIYLVLLLMTFAKVELVAQDEKSLTLRVNTRLVEVGLFATGKAGRSILDLTKEELSLTDNGAQQKIVSMTLASAQERRQRLAPPPGERVIQNRVTLPAGNLTIILLDDLNIEAQDRANARQQLAKSFANIPASQPVALYQLGSELKVIRDFFDGAPKSSNNFSVLDSASTPDEASNRKVEAMLTSAFDQISNYQALNRVETTLGALEAIGRRMKTVPGQKSLIWISDGIPFSIGRNGSVDLQHSRDSRDFSKETERTARVLADAQLVIYPIDARGVEGADDASIGRRMSSRSMSSHSVNSNLAYEEMALLADLTGGQSFHNSNDLASSIALAVERGSPTYTLAFYPDVKWDGAFHKLTVKVNRPGVKVRYRTGYFALIPADLPEPSYSLSEAIKSAQTQEAIGIVVGLSAKGDGYQMTVEVDPRELSLTKTGSDWIGSLELQVLPCATGNKSESGKPIKINIHLPEAQYAEALHQGLRFTTPVHMPKNADQIRIGVRDESSGGIGTLFLNIR